MSSKSYQTKPSWNPTYNSQSKTNKSNINQSLTIQAKGKNELNTHQNTTSDHLNHSGAMIANVQRSIEAGNIPSNSASVSFNPIQAKLTIGEPNDKYEQEADQVAAQVVQRINAPTPPSLPNDDGDDPIQRKPSIPILQRTTHDYSELNRKEIQAQLQRKGNIGLTAPNIQADFKSKLQFKGGLGINAPNIQADFESSLNSAKSGGSPLDSSFRAKIEPEMGADFSKVKVHTDSNADQLSKSIQAKAFTTGNDVFFSKGSYDTNSKQGQELLTHELTHTVQQGASPQLQKKSQIDNHSTSVKNNITNSKVLGQSLAQRYLENIYSNNFVSAKSIDSLNPKDNPQQTDWDTTESFKIPNIQPKGEGKKNCYE